MSRNPDIYYKCICAYRGERYFRQTSESLKVIQVCITAGDIKKGKSNTPGIYLIDRLTLISNYLAMNYLKPCTKATYQKKFKEALKLLQ